jgi:DNA anti-recombination protein RmuC
MAEEIKDVNKKIDEMDAAVKRYASKDTVISIGGYEFTPAKLMVAATIISSTLGGLYGCFEVYKDYMGMKKKIAEYVTPDLTEINKKLELVQQSSEKASQYTQDIKNDLKQDIRRLEGIVENVERSSKQSARESSDAINAAGREMKQTQKEINDAIRGAEKQMQALQRDLDRDLRTIRNEVDSKIKKALDNPLANGR